MIKYRDFLFLNGWWTHTTKHFLHLVSATTRGMKKIWLTLRKTKKNVGSCRNERSWLIDKNKHLSRRSRVKYSEEWHQTESVNWEKGMKTDNERKTDLSRTLSQYYFSIRLYWSTNMFYFFCSLFTQESLNPFSRLHAGEQCGNVARDPSHHCRFLRFS